MTNGQKHNITEEDVMFYDMDPVLYGEQARVRPTPSSEWIEFNAFDFFYWLVDIGRLDYFHGDTRWVCSNDCGIPADTFWRDLVISQEANGLINEKLTAEELAQTVAA